MIIQAGTTAIWIRNSPNYSAKPGARAVVTRDYDTVHDEFICVEFLPETRDLAGDQNDGGYYEDQFKFEPQLTLLHLF
jgi:hypothetical protein